MKTGENRHVGLKRTYAEKPIKMEISSTEKAILDMGDRIINRLNRIEDSIKALIIECEELEAIEDDTQIIE